MRLLFAHDHRFHRDPEGRVYSIGSFPAAVWQRYLRHFDAITVLGRDGGAPPEDSSLAYSSHPDVTFEFGPDMRSLGGLLGGGASRERVERLVGAADAVVARLPSEIGLMALKAARKLGKPYAVEVVGCAWDGHVNHGALAARLYAPVVHYRTRRAVSQAPLALYVTSAWLQRRYPNAGFSTYASNVEIVPLDDSGQRRREERLRELVQGRPVQLGTVASLRIRSKGVQTAIAALARLRREGLDLHYSVLGPGDQAPWEALAQREGVADLVSFAGTREAGEGVRDWLDSIDIHLQPSFQEGLPRATIEAMSRGVACIGSTCGGIPELLDPQRTHRPGDVAGLAACIRRLATDPAAIAAASKVDLQTSEDYRPASLQARRDRLYARLRAMAGGAERVTGEQA